MRFPAQQAATEIFRVPYDFVTITVKANGGSVTFEILHDYATDVWVPATAAAAADGAVTLFPGRDATLRVTPAGGATFTKHGPGF
jgi:hypothetical protein